MKDLGTTCRDVRTREVGIQEIHHKVRPYQVGTKYVLFALMIFFKHNQNYFIFRFFKFLPVLKVDFLKHFLKSAI